MELLTTKQQEVLWKKERMIELKDEGLNYPKIQQKLNEELKEKGLKEISLSWVKVNFHRLNKQN